mgnify:FL=1
MRVRIAQHVFSVHPIWLLITLTAFAILFNLSWWQLSRASEKTEQLQHLAQLQQNGALAPQQLAALSNTDVDGAPVQGNARWLSPFIWLLDNQIVDGKVGYDVIIPVQAEGLSQPLLVNLGWVAASSQRDVLPTPAISPQFQLDALLRTKTDGLMLLGQNVENLQQWPMRIQQADIVALSEISGLSLFPALLYQQQSDFVPHYQPVVLPPEKHRGYALQWFLLAVAVVGVALAASHQGKLKHE